MTQYENSGWNPNVNFNNAKKPLKDIKIALKMIKKDYEKKYKELIRLKKGMNDNSTM